MMPTQEELNMAQYLMDARMEELPISDMSYSATHEPAAVVDVGMLWTEIEMEESVIQKSTPTGQSLWRKASLAINACNRMRLVLESSRAVDEQTATQTATEINSLFLSPPFEEAVQAQLPNCSSFRLTTTEERHCQWIPATELNSLLSSPPFDEALQAQDPNCSSFISTTTTERHSQFIETSSMPVLVPSLYRTDSGKLVLVFKSVDSVERGDVLQIANQVISLVSAATRIVGSTGGSELPGLVDSNPGAVCAENEDKIDWLDVWMRNEHEEDEGSQFLIDDLGVVGSSNSDTGFVLNLNHAAQSRVNHPSTPDTPMTIQSHLLSHPPMEGVQHSPVMGTSCDMTPYQTASENTSRWEGDDGIESGWPNQECHRNPDSEPQMQLQKDEECQQWNELKSDLIKQITAKIEEIDTASERSKLQNMSDQANAASTKLETFVSKFKDNIENFFRELRKLFDRCSHSGQQHLLRALVDRFERSSLNPLVNETEGLSKKLKQLGKELHFRQNYANKIAQNCASNLSTLVETFLTKQSSNFLPKAILTKRYLKNFPVDRVL